MKNKVIFTFLSLLFTSSVICAQDHHAIKLGYTNLDYILGLLPEAKQVETDLQTYEKQLQGQLQSKYADYEKKLKDYQEANSKGLMTDVIKEDKEKELVGMQNSIKEFEQSAQSSLQKKQVSLLEPVLGKVQKAIDAVGAENNYNFIFSTHADYGGSAIILYAKSKEDNISDLVLKKLGVTPPPPGDNKLSGLKGAQNNQAAKTDPGAGSGAPSNTAPVKKSK